MGPMIQQIQSACQECKGEGESWSAKDKCTGTCKGKKVHKGNDKLKIPPQPIFHYEICVVFIGHTVCERGFTRILSTVHSTGSNKGLNESSFENNQVSEKKFRFR